MTKQFLRRRALFFLPCLLFLIIIVAFYELTYDNEIQNEFHHHSSYTNTNSSRAVAIHYHESLRYIPHSTVDAWSERDYLIVFGIPSVDVDGWRRRRYLQRTTCWQFPGVATRRNNFTGDMLVLYVLARHPSQGYEYSAALVKEAGEWHDIIALSMKEGVSTVPKMIGGLGYYSLEAGVGLSRKVYFWFELALGIFSKVNYFAKGDDDTFIYIPQFLADLKVLPNRCLYWGAMVLSRHSVHFDFAVGPCYTLSRDVAESFLSYKPLSRLLSLSYDSARESEYAALHVSTEDVMVGRVLHDVKSQCLVLVNESIYRFHDLHYSKYKARPTNCSVFLHHLKEKEYVKLMKKYSNRIAETGKKYKLISGRIVFDC
ncbi:hypothetical protein LSM04_003763 [Trypanosoma melophagium]|uniref:uncharacterized protein n=1 Tax=Trypanosoma melophagium TaxID=715481 RepID=UPI00351A58BA|nr:hypothetical protein LSM04_003763 [Trypanosoma melophagium]